MSLASIWRRRHHSFLNQRVREIEEAMLEFAEWQARILFDPKANRSSAIANFRNFRKAVGKP